jgi:hypothetical protein
MAKALGIFPVSTAVVKKTGIYFNNMIYASDVAIREQWFFSAAKNGEWDVPVFYDPQSDDYVFIKLKNGGLCIAYRVEVPYQKKMNKELLEEYYKKLNQLKLELRKRKSRGKKL